jgi:hypothetical protein
LDRLRHSESVFATQPAHHQAATEWRFEPIQPATHLAAEMRHCTVLAIARRSRFWLPPPPQPGPGLRFGCSDTTVKETCITGPTFCSHETAVQGTYWAVLRAQTIHEVSRPHRARASATVNRRLLDQRHRLATDGREPRPSGENVVLGGGICLAFSRGRPSSQGATNALT